MSDEVVAEGSCFGEKERNGLKALAWTVLLALCACPVGYVSHDRPMVFWGIAFLPLAVGIQLLNRVPKNMRVPWFAAMGLIAVHAGLNLIRSLSPWLYAGMGVCDLLAVAAIAFAFWRTRTANAYGKTDVWLVGGVLGVSLFRIGLLLHAVLSRGTPYLLALGSVLMVAATGYGMYLHLRRGLTQEEQAAMGWKGWLSRGMAELFPPRPAEGGVGAWRACRILMWGVLAVFALRVLQSLPISILDLLVKPLAWLAMLVMGVGLVILSGKRKFASALVLVLLSGLLYLVGMFEYFDSSHVGSYKYFFCSTLPVLLLAVVIWPQRSRFTVGMSLVVCAALLESLFFSPSKWEVSIGDFEAFDVILADVVLVGAAGCAIKVFADSIGRAAVCVGGFCSRCLGRVGACVGLKVGVPVRFASDGAMTVRMAVCAGGLLLLALATVVFNIYLMHEYRVDKNYEYAPLVYECIAGVAGHGIVAYCMFVLFSAWRRLKNAAGFDPQAATVPPGLVVLRVLGYLCVLVFLAAFAWSCGSSSDHYEKVVSSWVVGSLRVSDFLVSVIFEKEHLSIRVYDTVQLAIMGFYCYVFTEVMVLVSYLAAIARGQRQSDQPAERS